MNYGQKIAELRKKKKLTQSALGEKLNITAQAVSKWENNLSEPDIDSLKKMCEIFEVSMDELLGNPVPAKETAEPEPVKQTVEQPARIINGYCEACKKPVGPGEYTLSHYSYTPNAISKKVTETANQHLYCNACNQKVLKAKKEEEIKQKEYERQLEKKEARWDFWKGLIWGTVALVIAVILSCVAVAKFPPKKGSSDVLGYIILTIGLFALIPQLIWEGDCGEDGRTVVGAFFFFFCRSFTVPFGFIFELSLDGIIWLLTVKLALWIICGILSILFFLLGFFLSVFLSIIMFPFSLVRQIHEIRSI